MATSTHSLILDRPTDTSLLLKPVFWSHRDPIESYFSGFSPVGSGTDDWRQLQRFNALAKRERWDKEERSAEYKRLQQAWTEAVESDFEGSSILHYQLLCGDLEIDPIPETVTECKSELKAVFVNIVDLMEYCRKGRRGQQPKRFAKLKQLKKYSLENGKYYRKENAKAGVLYLDVHGRALLALGREDKQEQDGTLYANATGFTGIKTSPQRCDDGNIYRLYQQV